MQPYSKDQLYRGLLAAAFVTAPLASLAAPLYQWKFDGAVGTPYVTSGGGTLVPTGTGNFAGTGVSGQPGDNAFSVTNAYSGGGGTNGNNALAGGANVLTGVGTLSKFTITMWVKPNVNATFPRLLELGPTANPDSGSNPGINLLINANNLEMGVNGCNNSANTGISFTNGAWRFIAFSYDGTVTNPYFSPSNQALYTFNGNPVGNNGVALAGTTTTSVTVMGSAGLNTGAAGNFLVAPGAAAIGNAATLYLGNRQEGGRGLTGFLDDVRIYNTQLTMAELEAIRLESAPPPPPAGNPSFWKGGASTAWNAANWTSDLAGTLVSPLPVDGTAAATFAALSPGNLANTVLGANQNVKSLQFNTQSTLVGIGGTHNLTIGSSGVTLAADAGTVEINTTGQVILGADQAWTNLSASPFTVTSPISGAFALAKIGPGTIVLAGANSHASTTIESGTLKLGNVLALGPVTNTLNLNGGNLDLNNFNLELAHLLGGQLGNVINTAEGLATLTVNSPALAADTFGGHLNNGSATQTIAFTKSGPGTFNLNGGSNFTGNVNISGGVLGVGLFANGPAVVSALGNAQTAGRTITVAPGATLRFNSNNVFGNQNSVAASMPDIIVNSDEVSAGLVEAIRFNAMGKITLNGGTLTQSATSSNDALFQGYQFRSDIVVLGTRPSLISSPTGRANHLSAETHFDVADVTSNADVDLTVSNPLWDQSGDHASASGSLVKKGLGTMALTASNSYTGATRVEAGTLSITGNKSLSDTGALTVFAAAKLHIDSGSELVGSLVFRDALDVDTVQAAGTYGGPDAFPVPSVIMPTWTGSGVILVSTDPFPLWMSSFPGYNVLSLARRQKDGDADSDGLTNLTEFALNGNPVSGVASSKVRSRTELVSGQKALVVTIPVRENTVFTGTAPAIGTVAVDHLNYRIEGSNELGTFDQGVSEVPVLEEETLPLPDIGWVYRSFRLNGDIDGGTPRGPAGFLRVGVSEIPAP